MNSDKIRCLIIDDDPFIQDLLKDKLNQHFPTVEVLSTANSGTEGIQKIAAYKPELVFLDVEMADMTGFEMLVQVKDIDFQTIFITSYSHYAIKAIRFNALDYLLKPIDLGELKKAINRFKNHPRIMHQKENMALALKNMTTQNVADHVMVLKTQEGELRLVLNEIIHIEGERNYSYIYLKKNRKVLVAKTLIELEELLDSKGFYRCHKSHILNGNHIVNYQNGLFVRLSNNMKIPVSRRRKKPFLQWVETQQSTTQ